MSLASLVAMKVAAGRTKDLEDVEYLQIVRRKTRKR